MITRNEEELVGLRVVRNIDDDCSTGDHQHHDIEEGSEIEKGKGNTRSE